jgi:hypothetical protein
VAAKVAMYGPDWPERIDRRKELGPYEPRPEPPFEAEGAVLKDALRVYERAFGAVLTRYDGSLPHVPLRHGEPPRYFFYKRKDGDIQLVDIHIQRGQEEICPRQDTEFPLRDGDVIQIGELIC